MTQEALRIALEALEENHHLIEEHERPEYLVHYDQIISLLAKALAKEKALQALHSENERLGLYKDAYAQLEQEPVAKYSDIVSDGGLDPRNTTPPQRTWVGLTNKQTTQVIKSMPKGIKGWMIDWDLHDFSKAIETKLKEKNGFTEENT